MPAPSGFTTVSGSHFTDATGANIAYVIFFEPARSNGTPTSFHSGGTPGGQVSKEPVSVAAAAGTPFNINLADVSLTVPPFVGYNVWALDAASNKPLLGPGYFIQPTGAGFDFDAYIAGAAPTPTGTGSNGFDGSGIAGAGGGVTFVDTVTSAHLNLTFANGVRTVGSGADIGIPVAGVTFIDTVTSAHLNLTFASGVRTVSSGADIGIPVGSIEFADIITGAPLVMSFASGVEVIT